MDRGNVDILINQEIKSSLFKQEHHTLADP